MTVPASGTSIRSGTFWASLQPGEHILQCWSHEASLIEALEGFVGSGLREGEGVVVVASAPHLHELEKRLRAHWLEVDRARWEGRYVPLLSIETLARFMGADGLPDEARFERTVKKLHACAGAGGRGVRFFGEMVGELWARGNVAGAIQLENLWTRFLRESGCPLFCAYPRALFEGHPPTAMRGVCDLHTLVLPG